MFADRKCLFVDLMGWDVPVVDGRYEIDRFDGDEATYIIATDLNDSHLGSLRLLPTTRAHILGDIFTELCDGVVPSGPAIWEITRLCLPVRLRATGRLAVRNRLISAMVDHALANGIGVFTGVTSWSFLEQIRKIGWNCEPLGGARVIAGQPSGAFRIEIDDDTPARLALTGIYTPDTRSRVARQAA
jgi:acyl-homoserine lactone synthase